MQIQRFESIDEIRSLPGYIEQVSQLEGKVPALTGYYRFADVSHCARSECNQKHAFGYVLQTTTDPTVVIAIGNLCGAKVFGNDTWRAVSADFEKQIKRHQAHEATVQQIATLPAVLERIDALVNEPRGLHWFERAKRSLQSIISPQVDLTLMKRARRAEAAIVVSKELDRASDAGPGHTRDATYSNEVLGTFVGLAALAIPSPRFTLIEQLRDPLRSFTGIDADSLMAQKNRLKQFLDLNRNVAEKIGKVERQLLEARLFFTTDNLRLLAHLAASPGESIRLKRLEWNESQGIALQK